MRAAGWDGDITVIGAEPHLPYDRPPLSKQLLAGEREPHEIVLREPHRYEPLDLDLRLGAPATALDVAARTVALDGGEPVTFDGLLLATGATPRVIPGTPKLDGIHVLRTLDDALALRAAFDHGPRVVVVG